MRQTCVLFINNDACATNYIDIMKMLTSIIYK